MGQPKCFNKNMATNKTFNTDKVTFFQKRHKQIFTCYQLVKVYKIHYTLVMLLLVNVGVQSRAVVKSTFVESKSRTIESMSRQCQKRFKSKSI